MLKIHTIPEGGEKTNIYAVHVNGERAELNFARVSAYPFNTPWPGHQRPLDQTEEAAFISLESDEEVFFKVNFCEDFAKAVVRPLSKNVDVTIDEDGAARFTLKEYGAYTFEPDGPHNALHIFFNPVRDFKAECEEEKAKGRNVLYFGEGIHNVGDIEVPSHTTVTIDAGAIVYGSISAFNAKDVKIKGYGIIDGSKEIRTNKTLLLPFVNKSDNVDANLNSTSSVFNELGVYFDKNDKPLFDRYMEETKCLKGNLRFYFCENVDVEGVIMRDSSTFCLIPARCDNVIIDNVKTIGMWRYNSDGIDIFNCSNVIVKNSFLRNFDDCMVIKGIIGWDDKNNENITIENTVVWCDWGAALEIGAETNAPEYRNIIYRNCDLIHGQCDMMRIHHHNYAKIRNVSYENIHLEYNKYQESGMIQNSDGEAYYSRLNTGHPSAMRAIVSSNVVYGRDAQKGDIRDISYKNIYIHTDGFAPIPVSPFDGLDEYHLIENVRIENVYINGKKAESLDEIKYKENSFVRNVSFK